GPPDDVADVVGVAGDGGQLRLPGRVAQARHDVVGDLGHQAAVALPVFGETDGGQVGVGRLDEGAHARVRPHHVQRDRRPSASSTGGHRSVTTLHVSDALPAQADLHLVGDAQLHLVIFQGRDFPVNAANRNNLVADL